MADPAPQASSRIFVSYRREDSSGHVLALLPALRRHFGTDRIFKDTDNIPPGADFVKFIRRELESCSVLLAIIGREWLTIQDPRSKRPRLQNPDDFLRVEVGTALRNEQIRVIPVLVERSTMPAAEELPPDLAELAYRNAVELSDGRWDSDVQLLIQAVERATAVAEATVSIVQRPELLDLQKRRAREIAAQVTEAREAFEAQDYENTVWACEKALLLDPQHSEALQILDRARKAIDGQKIAAWLSEAQQLLNEGDAGGASDLIDQALSLDHTSQAALDLRKQMLALRRERERERERARAIRAATDRARSSFEHEEFEEAVRHADDALALDGEAAEALEIRSRAGAALEARRRQREHRRRAQQTVAEARAKFSAGQMEAAVRLLRDFSPSHELVVEALTELDAKAGAVTSVNTRVDDLIARATATLDAAQIDEAIALLSEAHGLDSGRSQITALLKQAKEQRAVTAAAGRARDEANRMLLDASARFSERDYAAAERLVESARSRDPQHPDIPAWLQRIRDAIEVEAAASRRQDAVRAAVAEATRCLEHSDFEQAIRHAEEALAIDAARADAREVRERASAALAERRAREDHEHRASETTTRARSLFEATEYSTAIRLLEAFQPPHPAVSRTLDELREKLRAIEERKRKDDEEAARAHEQRAREKQERREAEERLRAEETLRARVQALLAEAESQLSAGAFRAARKSAEAALKLSPGNETAQAIAAAATQKLYEASSEFWSTRHIRAGAAVAVIVVVSSAGVWYYRQSSQTPPSSAPVTRSTDRPAPPQMPSTTTPAAAGPGAPAASATPSREEARKQRLEELRSTARGQVTKGQRTQALSTIVEGLNLEPEDTDLRLLLVELLNEAQQAADRSKSRARTVNAYTLALTTFTQALKLEDEAVAFQQEGRKDAAARTFWRAAERFDLAAQQATALAQEARLRQQREDEARRRAEENQGGQKPPSPNVPTNPSSRAGPGPSGGQQESHEDQRSPVVTLPAPTPPSSKSLSRSEEAARVQALLSRYEAAHDTLNVDTLIAVFPSIDPRIVKGLRSYEYYRMDLVCRELKLSNDLTTAVAQCESSHWFKPKGSTEQRFRGQQLFTFQKRNDTWFISQIVDQTR